MAANWRLGLLIALSTAIGCDQFAQGGGFGKAMCPELGGGDPLSAQYSANARANAKLRAFVQASKDLAAVSMHIESEIADVCRRMGADLGVPPQEMQARSEAGGKASGACAAVSARIDAILRQGVQVQVSVTPPVCQASAQAQARCSGSCSAQIDPGQIVAQCQPARLSGFCQGRCIGRCEGRCNGQCRGQCSAQDAQGRCVGQCNGECDGGCDATCHAQCQGTWQAPKCEGMVQGPSADADCDASCRAHADVNASCTAPAVQVRVNQNAEMAMRLMNTLQANLPRLVYAEIALGKRLLGDARVVAQVGGQLPSIIGDAGAHALACVGASAEASAAASARIDVSVRASVSVTGKVGASSG